MITYDYTLETTIGKNKSQKYVPEKLPNRLPNMVCIEGPNASGKSTLLNIIALGFFGLKNRRINPLLQVKMNSLLDPKYQKLKFSFEIESKDGELLRADKSDMDGLDIVVKEALDGKNFKPLSFERFEKKYNLIYDIPNNPTARLPELLKELKDEQLHFGTRVNQFSIFLNNVITDISNSRNQKKLEETKTKLDDFLKQKENIDNALPGQQSFLDELEKAAYLKYYLHFLNECDELSQSIDLLQNELKGFEDSGKTVTSRITIQKKKISNLQGEFTQYFRKISTLLEGEISRKDKQRYKIWKDINPYTVEDHELDTIVTEALYYRELFGRQIESMEKDTEFKNASIFKKMLDSLKEFEDSGVEIPQIKVTIGQLVEILEQQNQKNIAITNKYRNLNEILSSLDKLDSCVKDLRADLEGLKKEKAVSKQHAENVPDYYEQKKQIERAKKDLEDATLKRDQYLSKCISKGIDKQKLMHPSPELFKEVTVNAVINEYLSFTEDQIQSRINSLNRDITNKRNQIPGLNLIINQLSRDLRQLETLKSHKHEQHIEQLNNLHQRTLVLSQKILRDYNNDLQLLIDVSTNSKEVSPDDLPAANIKYFNEVYKYLAHRIGTFKHVNSVYKAKVVNIISKTIITEDDYIIRIDSMSTGQTMSAYLLSLLNVPKSDDRKIIALFDEIAMMDDASLEPVCCRLRELYTENRLVLGILVQKSNTVNVKAL